MKRFLAFMLSVSVTLTLLPMEYAMAEELPTQSEVAEETVTTEEAEPEYEVPQYDDVIQTRPIEVPFDSICKEGVSDVAGDESGASDMQVHSATVGSRAYNDTFWDKYSTNYYYNQLTDVEKAIWDNLDSACLEYLNGTADFPRINLGNETPAYLGEIVTSALTLTELKDLSTSFRISNPQYYFLNASLYYGTSGDYVAVGIGVYEKFATGSERAVTTAEVKNKIQTWEQQLSSYITEFDKAKAAHDLIINAVDYNHAVFEDDYISDEEDETYITQSAYSALTMDTTVCAGYSMAYEMLLNSVGVDCFSVTSEDHQWNTVRVNYAWYNVDCTWDDGHSGSAYPIMYAYFLDNDANFRKEVSHKPLEVWSSYLPVCTLTTNSTETEPGTLPTSAGTVETPGITVRTVEDVYELTASCGTPNAQIYFTLDGNNPSVAATRSSRYQGPTFIEDYKNLKVIAVCDNYADSSIATPETVIRTSYNIKFSKNKLSLSGNFPEMKYCSYDTNYQLPTTTTKKTGYYLAWNTRTDGTGTDYKAGATVRNLTEKASITLYAVWRPQKYKITYNLNSGTNNSKNPSYYYITSDTIKLASPTRKGYKFGGWYSDSGYKNRVTEIAKGTTGNKTLYAKWSKTKYTITYNINGGTNSSKNPGYYYVTSDTIKLASPTRKGYKFAGWYSDSGYKNKVTEIAKGTTGNKTLYAKWSKTKYTITYNMNGGTNNSKNPAYYYITSSTITLQNPTRKGYKFAGWYSDSGYKNKVTEIKKGSTGSKTLYAKWSVVTYKITYNMNGGTNSSKNPASYKVTTSTVTLQNPTRRGYTFGGWYTNSSFSGSKVTQIAKGSVGNKNLYAKWTKTKYAIAYNLNGGTNNSKNPAYYYITSNTITLQNPTKTGYTFGGWYSDSGYKTRVKEITKGSVGKKTLYAKWTANQYTIKFSGNGSTSGSMSNLTGRKYGTGYKLTDNAFKKTGYTFAGWNTKADGSGKAYVNQATVKNLTSKNGGTVTLYAQWTKYISQK